MPKQLNTNTKKESDNPSNDEMLREYLKDNYGKNLEAEEELGKPITKLEALLLMEKVLCDVNTIYVVIDLLIEKGIVSKKEFDERLSQSERYDV